jgi:hypothetical protein
VVFYIVDTGSLQQHPSALSCRRHPVRRAIKKLFLKLCRVSDTGTILLAVNTGLSSAI